jgi:hypothetical protein
MSLRTPTENENGGISSIPRSPRPVIPAHAGIQVCSAELVWIPAFAGMTIETGLFVLIRAQVFSKKVTKITTEEISMKKRIAFLMPCQFFVSFARIVVRISFVKS